jgi:hypothetical protein
MKPLGTLILTGAAVLALLQFLRPSIPSRPDSAPLQAPPEVVRILNKDCYSCHSDQKRLSWFDQIVPAYWLVRHDVLDARKHLNFSLIGSKPAAAQKATLYEAVNMIQLGAMPLPQFVQLHPEARVTPQELATLKAYLAPWNPAPAAASTLAPFVPVALDKVSPELNGFPFDAAFENWKLIGTTDRGDNHTFRFILGNDIAYQAAQSGHISPWPDGSRLAKIAWQQETAANGLILPGKFVQVELMAKDARQFKKTEGWGWGRWRGLDLKPYGKDAQFVTECTTCHLPVRGDDSVYTLPISSAHASQQEKMNNRAAALPASLAYQPLAWQPITMYVDPGSRSMAILFGNQTASSSYGKGSSSPPQYAAGSVLALVTWAQRDDPHWFGARIPDVPLSVEFIQIASRGEPATYRRFTGPGIAEDRSKASFVAQRTAFIESLVPAQLP